MKAIEVRARMADLIGYGWQADFAEAIDVRGPTVTEQLQGDRVTAQIAAIIELLEVLPLNQWPPRWHKLAARVKAKKAKSA